MLVVEEIEHKNTLPEKYKVVADVIRVGKSNSTLLRDIMILADIDDRRQAYNIIEQLIVKYEYPIIASKKSEYRGYYYPANKDELEEARSTLNSSIVSLTKRHKALKENYKKLN